MRTLLFLIPIVLILSGCGGSRPTKLTWNEPPDAAAKAITTYDANSDGQLSADELKKSPALTESLRRLDTNKNGKLSADEIQARFEELYKWIKYLALEPTITSNRRPAVGAEVTLTPEQFMGEDFMTYNGTVTADGTCQLRGDGRYLPGVPVGFYTLKIVEPGKKEVIRGVEVAADTTGGRLEIAL